MAVRRDGRFAAFLAGFAGGSAVVFRADLAFRGVGFDFLAGFLAALAPREAFFDFLAAFAGFFLPAGLPFPVAFFRELAFLATGDIL